MGVFKSLTRKVLFGHWKKSLRPTFWERVVLNDKDDQRRQLSRDEIFKVARKGWLNWGAARCVVCGSFSNLSVDHVKPLSKGGTNEASNLQIMCRKCNSRKNAKWGISV